MASLHTTCRSVHTPSRWVRGASCPECLVKDTGEGQASRGCCLGPWKTLTLALWKSF